MAFLVDTNILVYRHDPRFPDKQARATSVLREGVVRGDARLPHQALVEFVAATTRPIVPDGSSLLTRAEALHEVEELMAVFPVIYPDAATLRLAVRGAATYQLQWFDAHLWAYAEQHGLPLLLSEDFQHGRFYGTVQVVNPFETNPSSLP
jgi:predicted nucleic acid-binding protein